MDVVIYPGWPLRYAHVVVPGMDTEHAANGIICLWAEDDPAQVEARDLEILWARLDEWAGKVKSRTFGKGDQALDAWISFEGSSRYRAELPLGDLVRRGSNGFRTTLWASIRGALWQIEYEPHDEPSRHSLRGAFFQRARLAEPPRTLDAFKRCLTRKQLAEFERGLAERAATGVGEVSQGLDFVVLSWPRHGADHDALVLAFENRGANLRAIPLQAAPNDEAAMLKRAGPDAESIRGKKVLIAGLGSVGSHTAISLASSGVTKMALADDDMLVSANLTRHACYASQVGLRKTEAVSELIAAKAPWCEVVTAGALDHDPEGLRTQIASADLVVDCTGLFSISAALSEVCWREGIALISGAIFHQGSLVRVRRQSAQDVPISIRSEDARYLQLPPEDGETISLGFLEVGCTAPVNSAPPASALLTAAEVSRAASDLLSGRLTLPDEALWVLAPLAAPPFDQVGVLTPSQDDATIERSPA